MSELWPILTLVCQPSPAKVNDQVDQPKTDEEGSTAEEVEDDEGQVGSEIGVQKITDDEKIEVAVAPDLVLEEEHAEKEVVECIDDIVRLQEEIDVGILQQEQEEELGDANNILDSDVESEEDENEEEIARDADDHLSLQGGRRKIGDVNDVVDDLQSYRTRKVDPISRCPPPAPKKIHGGRRTLLKQTMEAELPEDEVQRACTVFKNRKSLRPEDLNAAQGGNIHLLALRGPMAPLMLQHQMQEQLSSDFKKVCAIVPSMSVDYLKLNRKSKGFKNQMYYEHLNYVSEATYAGQETDPGAWLTCFAKAARKRFSGKLKSYTSESLGILMQNMGLRAATNVTEMKNRYLSSAEALSKLIDNIDKISRAKGRIMDDLDDLHRDLSKREPKFDELSMSGIRLVKMILDPPYIKSEDGGLAPRFAAKDQIVTEAPFFFRWDKQKWTTKDLKALRQCIKETIVTKKCDLLEAKYICLMKESAEKREMELEEEGRTRESLNLPPVKRKRGRPTKEEVQQRDKYGVINPIIAALNGDVKVTIKVTPKGLSNWRTNKEKRWKGMSFEALVKEDDGHVDWKEVAQKMMMKSRKFRTADDCRLAWVHEVDPNVNTKRWSAEETRNLKVVAETSNNDWPNIAKIINKANLAANKPIRTTYLCYFRYRNRINPPARLEWTDEMDDHVKTGIKKYPTQWRKIASSMSNDAATKRAVVERYKKNINPMLRTGSFTRVEDALLILTIEKLKPFLAREGHFGSLLAYLPWRYETTWRDRANNLFNDWIVPWTMDEDKLLLDLAESMKRNWQKISEEFTSFKNRKGCLTRYKILTRNLKDSKRFPTLESYHEAYAMTRYNVFQYRHLNEILTLLKRIRDFTKFSPDEEPFLGLNRNEEPSEIVLKHMLFAFDREVMISAIDSLEKYIKSRDEYWEIWKKKFGGRKRTFDRRTFHRNDPQSVASAIHIRGLKLKPKNRISGLTDFENEIYTYYGRFSRTKSLNVETKRPYIPSGKDLITWSVVSRIISTKLDEVKEGDDVPANRKWRTRTPKKCNCCTLEELSNHGNKCVNNGKARTPKTKKVQTGEEMRDETHVPKRRGRKPNPKKLEGGGSLETKRKRGRPAKKIKLEPRSNSSDSENELEAEDMEEEGPVRSMAKRRKRANSTERVVRFNIKMDEDRSGDVGTIGSRTRSKRIM